MYYYHYLHQKYKDDKDGKDEEVERSKDKFENPCLCFFTYIINCLS